MREIKVENIFIFFSLVVAILSAFASLTGIFNTDVYSKETSNWALQARGQDVGNILAIPILLLSTYLLFKKSFRSFVVWLGVLMYFIYAYTVYAFAVHFNLLFLIYIAILGFSIYTLIGGLVGKDYSLLENIIPLNSKTKSAAILLIIIGTLFGLLWLSELIPSIITGQTPKSLIDTGLWVNPIHVIDLSTVLPGMILTGILFLKRNRFGLLFAAPWLTFSFLMGSSIVATMVMMSTQGYPDTLPPLIMTGIIVLLSLIFLVLYLKEIE